MSTSSPSPAKIEKLTPAQEKELAAFYQEQLKIGRSIEPINHEKAESIITRFYERIGKPKPSFMYFSSPAMCIMAKATIDQTLKNDVKQESQLWSQLGSQLRSQLWSQLWSQLGSQLESQLGSQLWSQLRSQLWSQLWSQLGSQLESQLGSQLWSQLRSQLWSQLGSEYFNQYFAGQQWIYWQSFYEFSRQIGVTFDKKDADLLDEWLEEGKHLHWWFPYENTVLISERPICLSVNTTGQLHHESEKAIEYSDGWGFYSLNGVVVPEELVKTPAENLSIDFFKNEKNADVKAEFVRKFGVERMLDFGKQTDTFENYSQSDNPWWYHSQYELWDMAAIFPGLDYQPYLKMRNQTSGIWHVEAVSPDCRKLPEAIKERFGGRDMKIVAIA